MSDRVLTGVGYLLYVLLESKSNGRQDYHNMYPLPIKVHPVVQVCHKREKKLFNCKEKKIIYIHIYINIYIFKGWGSQLINPSVRMNHTLVVY